MLYMKEYGIRELRQNASQIIAELHFETVITITDRGRPVAQLVSPSTSKVDALIEAGKLSPPMRSLKDLGKPLIRKQNEPALSDVLFQQRNSEQY